MPSIDSFQLYKKSDPCLWQITINSRIVVLLMLIMVCCSSTEALAGVNQPPASGAPLVATANSNIINASNDSGNKEKPPPPQPRSTFYRRILPDSCVALSSQEGQTRFASAMATKGLKSFFRLIEQFTTQSEPAFCGVSTLVIVLNTLAIDPRRAWKGPWRWYEESMLNCCVDPDVIKETGITINDFRCLAICQGLAVTVVLAEDAIVESDDNNDNGNGEQPSHAHDKGVDAFRQAVKQACVASDDTNHNLDEETTKEQYLVVSYTRKVLRQTGSGHFSPIAAYDSASDSVLVLDTARFKYGVHWVSLPLLFEAMIPKDPDTGKSRGYILLSDRDEESTSTAIASTNSPSLVLPSVLFRSQRAQNPVRRDYKEFLSQKRNDTLTFDHVASFWTVGGVNATFIWKMLEPQFTPLKGDEAVGEIVDSVRLLVDNILEKIPRQPLPDACCACRINFSRTIDLTPKEAIFVVYLASLDEKKRRELVLSPDDGAEKGPTIEQTQLLAEAELIRCAIEMSDETSQT